MMRMDGGCYGMVWNLGFRMLDDEKEFLHLVAFCKPISINLLVAYL